MATRDSDRLLNEVAAHVKLLQESSENPVWQELSANFLGSKERIKEGDFFFGKKSWFHEAVFYVGYEKFEEWSLEWLGFQTLRALASHFSWRKEAEKIKTEIYSLPRKEFGISLLGADTFFDKSEQMLKNLKRKMQG